MFLHDGIRFALAFSQMYVDGKTVFTGGIADIFQIGFCTGVRSMWREHEGYVIVAGPLFYGVHLFAHAAEAA